MKPSISMVGGRPPKFKTPEALQELIDSYFDSCWAQKIGPTGIPIFIRDSSGKPTKKKVLVQIKPYTVSGLALFLNTTRGTLSDYEAKGRFSDTIKRAKLRVLAFAEESLFTGKNPTGTIFNLKNNWGWKDKTETDISSKGQPLIIQQVSYEDACPQ